MSEKYTQTSPPEEMLSIWEKIILKIREELSDQSFNAWIAPISCKHISEDSLILSVPDRFYGDWVREHYETLIQSAAVEVIGSRPPVHYEISQKPSHSQIPKFAARATTQPEKKKVEEAGLNSKYTFDSFVIGSGNRFAHAASLAVSEELAKRYNPLFIYGGVGLGKTHLLQAIAHCVIEKNENSKVVYISSEKFTNQLISAIQTRSTALFREKYRVADLLLIDDIHFIAGKESTQEEFFHTFNTLYDSHKQIVVTSDRPPKDIPSLEERLVSRFEWGLIADIQPPDLETRVAILRKKIEKQDITIPDNVLFLIAEKIRSNIRELEGALIRVIARSSLTDAPMGTDLVQEVLKDAFKEEETKITIDHIQRCVSEFFGIRVSDLRAKRRTSSVVFPRQIAMLLARELTKHSLPEIGDYFGGRGHATVLYGVNKMRGQLQNDKEIKKVVDQIVILIKK